MKMVNGEGGSLMVHPTLLSFATVTAATTVVVDKSGNFPIYDGPLFNHTHLFGLDFIIPLSNDQGMLHTTVNI